MTPEEFADKMREIEKTYEDEPDIAHIEADVLLCKTLEELGFVEGIWVFHRMTKWYE